MAFYVEYGLRLSSGQSTFLLAAVMVVAIGCVALWAWLVKKFTLMPVWFESGDNPGTQPDAAARFLMTIVPPVLMVISFAFSWFINLKKPAETQAEPKTS